MAVYVYAVVRPDMEPPDAVALVQPSSGALRLVAAGSVGALAADFDAPRVRMTASNLRAHHDVVERAAARGDLVPVQFGAVFESESSLRDDMLTPREQELRDVLEAFRDHVEVLVTTTYVADAAFRDAVAANPRLQRSGRRSGIRPRAGYHEQIALGELAMQEVAGIQQRDLRALLEQVSATAGGRRVVRTAPDGSSRMAFLVRRGLVDAFEQALERFARAQKGRMDVEMVGPVAPWDFADLGGPNDLGASETPVGAGR